MKTVILVLIFTLTLYAAALAQSNFTDDTFVITTYYPAPYGVYRNMRLQPSDDPTGREGVVEGVMYYDQTLHMMRYLNDTGWVNVTAGGGGEGYWTKSGNSIHNNNTGNVNIGTNPTQTLEVSGKIFMRNETNATDPSYTVATRGYLSAFTSPILKVYTGA